MIRNPFKTKDTVRITDTQRIDVSELYDGGWVEINTNPPLDQFLSISQKISSTEQDMEQYLPIIDELLTLVVEDWNFADRKGRELKVTPDNVKGLPLKLKVHLASKVPEVISNVPLGSKEDSSTT